MIKKANLQENENDELQIQTLDNLSPYANYLIKLVYEIDFNELNQISKTHAD